jgi:hypothetical protein
MSLLSSMLPCAYAGSCSQVDIYDAYVVDLDTKRAAAEAKAKAERVRVPMSMAVVHVVSTFVASTAGLRPASTLHICPHSFDDGLQVQPCRMRSGGALKISTRTFPPMSQACHSCPKLASGWLRALCSIECMPHIVPSHQATSALACRSNLLRTLCRHRNRRSSKHGK